jgi:hypothetical protein
VVVVVPTVVVVVVVGAVVAVVVVETFMVVVVAVVVGVVVAGVVAGVVVVGVVVGMVVGLGVVGAVVLGVIGAAVVVVGRRIPSGEFIGAVGQGAQELVALPGISATTKRILSTTRPTSLTLRSSYEKQLCWVHSCWHCCAVYKPFISTAIRPPAADPDALLARKSEHSYTAVVLDC